jgi:NitT/TauT family transport system substrate-binding protein
MTISRSKAWLAAILLLLAGALALYLLVPREKSGPTKPTETSLRLAWVYDMAEVGVFVAQDKGYFEQSGLRLTTEPGGFGLDPIKLVAAGSNDFGVAGAGNLLLARAQGVPVVAIAAEFQETPVGFIVRENSPIRSFTDFRGKRVGIQTGADTDVLYRALLSKNGMTSSEVKEVPIQYDPGPFVSGQIDVLPGYVTNQPVTLRGKGLPVRVLSAKSQGAAYYGNVYFTTETMLKQKPELVRQFLRAVQKGWLETFANKPAALSAMTSRSKDFEAQDLSTIYDAVMPFIRPGGAKGPFLRMTDERWESTRRVLADAGLLKANIDLKAAYTNDLLP